MVSTLVGALANFCKFIDVMAVDMALIFFLQSYILTERASIAYSWCF